MEALRLLLLLLHKSCTPGGQGSTCMWLTGFLCWRHFDQREALCSTASSSKVPTAQGRVCRTPAPTPHPALAQAHIKDLPTWMWAQAGARYSPVARPSISPSRLRLGRHQSLPATPHRPSALMISLSPSVCMASSVELFSPEPLVTFHKLFLIPTSRIQ